MIARVWRGRAADADGADAYLAHFEARVAGALAVIPGHLGAFVLRRAGEGGVEIEVTTLWVSFDAIRAFAGSDLEQAVVEPEARAALVEVEARVRHFEVARATWPRQA